MPRFSLSQFTAIKGDGEADDTLPYLDALRQIPDGVEVEWPMTGYGPDGKQPMRPQVRDTIPYERRRNLRIVAAGDPRDTTPQERHAGFVWGGKAGGDVVVLNRCLRVKHIGIAVSATLNNEAIGGASRCWVTDAMDNNPGPISSRNEFERCVGNLGFRNADGIGFDNARNAGVQQIGNCEYPKYTECMVRGGGGAGLVRSFGRDPFGWPGDATIRVQANSTDAYANMGQYGFRPSDVGERFATAVFVPVTKDNPWGIVQFTTTIRGVVDSTHAVLADASPGNSIPWNLGPDPLKTPRPSFGGYAIIGKNYGTAWRNGNTFNAKRAVFDDCEAYACEYGVHSLGGSLISELFNFSDCEADWVFEGSQAEPSHETGTQSENSRHHVWNLMGPLMTMSKSRISPVMQMPGAGFLSFGAIGNGQVAIDYSQIDPMPTPPGAWITDLRRSSRLVTSRMNSYSYADDRERMGWTPELLGPGTIIHSDMDMMQGGPAQTAAEEWMAADTPDGLTRRSGHMNHINGMPMNPAPFDQIRILDESPTTLYTVGKAKRAQRYYRDADGQLYRETAPLGKVDETGGQ